MAEKRGESKGGVLGTGKVKDGRDGARKSIEK
jgi:hypothetical protein